METRTTVKIIDKTSPYYGQEFKGYNFYCDHLHTGSSDDIFLIETPDGVKKILSSSVDVDHYNNQNRQNFIAALGANEGDVVKIVETGSGLFRPGFSTDKLYVISKIDSYGHVEFSESDRWAAQIFRPKVEIVSL